MRVPVERGLRTIIVVDRDHNNKELLRYFSPFVPNPYTEQMSIDGKTYIVKCVEHVVTTEPHFEISTVVFVEWGRYTKTGDDVPNVDFNHD
jgi:hypothetical protein